MTALYQIVSQYRALEQLDASEDLPIEVINDTLEGLTGELTEKATNVAKFVLNCESMADAIDNAAKLMKARSERLRRRADGVREYLKTNMIGAGITKIESVEFVLAIKKNPPSVIVDDEAAIPEHFKVTPEPAPPPVPRPDKKQIATALKAGMKVPGCHLEQAERLDIR